MKTLQELEVFQYALLLFVVLIVVMLLAFLLYESKINKLQNEINELQEDNKQVTKILQKQLNKAS